MSSVKAECASKAKWTDWNSIDWKKVRKEVRSLQRRIVKAVENNDRTAFAVLCVLEPCDGKLSSTVLRGERESNLPDLLDRRTLETMPRENPRNRLKLVKK